LRGRALAARGDYSGAVDDFTRALTGGGQVGPIHVERAKAYAQLRRWQQSSDDLERARKGRDALAVDRLAALHAMVLLANNDLPAYRRVCASVVAALQSHKGKLLSGEAVWCCLLRPDGVTDWRAIVEKLDPNRSELLGPALYRAGRFKQAKHHLREGYLKPPTRTSIDSDSAPDEGNPMAPVEVDSHQIALWYFQAMTEHRLGETKSAADWLSQANEALLATKSSQRLSWSKRLQLEILQREATRLIGKTKDF
jgi:tetratricopeptide (TPR) repeat protein